MNSYVWDLKVERLIPVDNAIRYVNAEAYHVAPGTHGPADQDGTSVTQASM
jgi:hypothetical protein